MFLHILRLIWNRKRKNILLIVEIFFSFIVLFAVVSYSLNKYENYKIPAGFDYKNVWVVDFDWEKDSEDEVRQKHELIRGELKGMNAVKDFSFASWSTPFSYSGNRTARILNGERVFIDVLIADERFTDVLNVPILQGRKFEKSDKASSILISEYFVTHILNGEPNIGNNLKEIADFDYTVKGVIPVIRKESPFSELKGTMLILNKNEQNLYNSVFLRVADNSGAELEENIIRKVSRVTKNWNVRIERLENKRDEIIKEEMIPVVVFSLLAGFLILNVALGLFGVLWYNIENRKAEIGLRRVFGAVSLTIQKQVVIETLILTIFGLTLGVFFVIQIPLLNLFNLDFFIVLMAIFVSTIFISLISMICSFYPSKIASRITPALVLHED